MTQSIYHTTPSLREFIVSNLLTVDGNINSRRCNTSWLKKHGHGQFIRSVDQIILFNEPTLSLSFKCKLIKDDVLELPLCAGGNPVSYNDKWRNYLNDTCGDLSCQCVISKRKNTLEGRYGDPHFNNRVKALETEIDRYGCSHNQLKQCKDKTLNTKLNKYGDPHFNNRPLMKETKYDRYGDEYYNNQEKARSTNVDRYGHATYSQSVMPDRYKELKSDEHMFEIMYRLLGIIGMEEYYQVSRSTVNNDLKHFCIAHSGHIQTQVSDMSPSLNYILARVNGTYQHRKRIYYDEVRRITKQQDIDTLEYSGELGLTGVDGAYHIDHIVSVKFGFDNDVPPEVIGDISNLQCIPWKDNIMKSDASYCFIDNFLSDK